jgi:uncharacterized membrane protein
VSTSIIAAEQRAQARQRAADRKVEAVRTRQAAHRTPVERLADGLTRIAGAPAFLALHVIWFAAWVGWNALLSPDPFDPYPFGFLTMVVSLEAIFLSIFVLMSQRRESRIAELRDEMTLEIDMRTEEEVTKTLQLVAGLYGRLGLALSADDDAELRAMLQPLDRERLSAELSAQIERAAPPAPASPLIILGASHDRR